MGTYKQKQKYETWTCNCGIKRKIREKNKPCFICKKSPKREEKGTAIKGRLLRHLKIK